MNSSSQMVFTIIIVVIVFGGMVIPMFYFVSHAERHANELIKQIKKERENKTGSKRRGKKQES